MLYSIGEFSQITSLSVKTLRFYHEKGLLIPSTVDQDSGYRYYDSRNADTARVIARLRELEFPIAEITTLLNDFDDDADILEYLKTRRQVLTGRIQNDRELVRRLNQIVNRELEARKIMENAEFKVEEKELEPLLIAGYRMKGKYADIGKGFGKVGKAMGFNIRGPAFGLYYDDGYREENADFEACMILKKEKAGKGVDVRTLEGGRTVALIHRGSYDNIGRSYEKLTAYVKERGLTIIRPTREVYIKGPGMIFKGNPKKYITEIQMLVE